MDNPDIIFFDLDHTLIDTDCEWAWKHMLADMGLVPESQRARQDYYIELHAEGKTPAEEYLEFLTSDFVGKTTDEMSRLAEKNFDANIRHKVFPEAVDEIEGILSAGGKPVLLSGSFRPIVGSVAAHLGFEEIVCTELEVVGGRFTGRLESEFCIREGKLKRARDYCTQHDHQLCDAVFFGDSLSDVQVFEQVAQANVVNPRPGLARLAKQNGWRIVHWGRLSEPQ
jgi:HAD superfamily hydrolase (TIGR01490 family)